MAKQNGPHNPDAPLYHQDHPRPITRRDFISQGFIGGSAMVSGNALLNFFMHPEEAQALATDILSMDTGPNCAVGVGGNLKIPFISFDLAGGANIAGSNVLVGQQGGQSDNIDTGGYSRLGLPGDRLPGQVDVNARGNSDFTDTRLGLAFHSESALLAGIMDKVSVATAAKVNGFVIPARSANDTGNNPHNPLYGIARAGVTNSILGQGAKGSLLTLIGSRATDSGGNSMAPAAMINPGIRPTKIDRPSDVVGLVDTGDLLGILSQSDAVEVMQTVSRISDAKISNTMDTKLGASAQTTIEQLMRCGYVKSAEIAEKFGDPTALDPSQDPNIVGPTAIFTQAEFDSNGEFRKTASVMKLVCTTLAGAGNITMGGYDYHTGNRIAGETRDLRAGRCIGACIEYASKVEWVDNNNNPQIGVPLMIYVFSDGSVFSNGTLDMTALNDGGVSLPGGKGVWTGDNSSTASSFVLVFNPNGAGRPTIRGGTQAQQDARQQLGYFRASGAVETSARTPLGNPILAANNVTSLVNTVLLNYMALHGDEGDFGNVFPDHGLGDSATLDEITVMNPIVNNDILTPI